MAIIMITQNDKNAGKDGTPIIEDSMACCNTKAHAISAIAIKTAQTLFG
jgi:hypothetical protein